MRNLYLIVICLIWSACEPPQALHQDKIILGHAGEGIDVLQVKEPANSIASIKAAIELYQLDGVEVDIQFDIVDKPYLYHDKYLEESTTDEGAFYEQNASLLKGHYHGSIEQIVSLEELFKYYQERGGFKISLNIKNYDPFINYSSTAGELLAVVNRYHAWNDVYIESADLYFLDIVKAYYYKAVTLLNGQTTKDDLQRVLDHNYNGLVTRYNEVDLDIAKQMKDSGKLLVTYGQLGPKSMNHPATIESDVIQVDNPIAAKRGGN